MRVGQVELMASRAVRGLSVPQVCQKGSARFNDAFAFDATIFTLNNTSEPPTAEFEPKPLEFQVLLVGGSSAPDVLVALARINLSEYVYARDGITLRSLLRPSKNSPRDVLSGDVVVKFKLRCNWTKLDPPLLTIPRGVKGYARKTGCVPFE